MSGSIESRSRVEPEWREGALVANPQSPIGNRQSAIGNRQSARELGILGAEDIRRLFGFATAEQALGAGLAVVGTRRKFWTDIQNVTQWMASGVAPARPPAQYNPIEELAHQLADYKLGVLLSRPEFQEMVEARVQMVVGARVQALLDSPQFGEWIGMQLARLFAEEKARKEPNE